MDTLQKTQVFLTPIEIELGVDENGMTTARNLYNFLELAQGQFSRWAKANITENEFATENEDWWGFDINVEGNVVKDYKLTAHFAKKLSVKGKQTQAWIETRKAGKLTRKAETDTIKNLVEYAKTQGSQHADKLYMTYSKLANKMAGVTKRDEATVMQLNNLSLMEHIILCVIDAGREI